MTITNDAARVFADARVMYAAAMGRLDAEDARDTAGKAWCATRRATDALILSRTGTEPEKSPDTTRGLDTLASQDPLGGPLFFQTRPTTRPVFLLWLV